MMQQAALARHSLSWPRRIAALALLLATIGASAAERTWRVAIDVGHTLEAPGATSARGRTEFAFNQVLAEAVGDALTKLGVDVIPINSDGNIGALADRPAQATAVGADFLLSIHHDSVGEWELSPWTWAGRTEYYSDRWQGHSLFVSQRNADPERSLLCASAIGARLQRAGFMPTDKNARRRDYADAAHAVHYYDNLVVLYRATQPAVLFEAGVIRHRVEELLLLDAARQARMAGEIATGIAACLAAGRTP